MGNYLCFDLGTTKIKSSLVNEDGKIIYLSEEEAKTYYGKDSAIQKPEEYFETVINEINKMKEKNRDDFRKAEYFICSSQMGGILGIDKDWNTVFPWTHGTDTRYGDYVLKIENEMASEIRKSSGGAPTVAGKILWIKDKFPDTYKKIYRFMHLTTYVAGKISNLKGDDAFIDYSFLTIYGLADVKKGKWNESICSSLGIDIGKLPKILKPFDCIGCIDKKRFGTKKDIKVLAGCGDQIAGFLGSGTIKKNDLVDVTGTYTVLGYCSDKFNPDYKDKIMYSIFTGISDIYYQMAVIAAGGYTYNWFREKFKYNNKRSFNKIKDTKGLYFIPYMGGRFSPSQLYFEGSWIGIKWEHDLDSFYTSLLESFGYELNFLLKFIKKLNNLEKDAFSEIKVIGGGSQNRYWNQIKSNILNIDYLGMEKVLFEIIGIFLIAKYKDNLKDGYEYLIKNNVISVREIIKPERERVEFYKKHKNNYIKIVKGLADVYYSLNIN